jgi:hypothetical protein
VPSSRPASSITAATCRSRWVSTPTVTGAVGAGMLFNVVPSGLIGQGRHAPAGTADSTAMGPVGQAPIGSRSPDRWVSLDTPGQLVDSSVSRHQAGETSSQTSHRGHPAASSQRDFSLHPQDRPAGGLRPPLAGDTTSQVRYLLPQLCSRASMSYQGNATSPTRLPSSSSVNWHCVLASWRSMTRECHLTVRFPPAR